MIGMTLRDIKKEIVKRYSENPIPYNKREYETFTDFELTLRKVVKMNLDAQCIFVIRYLNTLLRESTNLKEQKLIAQYLKILNKYYGGKL